MPRWREGCSSISEELLRVAYVTAVPFIPRFIFLAPCSPSPPSSSFLFLRWKRPTNPRRPSTVKRGTAIPTESKKKEEEIFLHTRWGVIARHNVTNFQLLRGSPSLPHPPPPQTLPERAFKSSTKPPLPPSSSLPFPSLLLSEDQPSRRGRRWGGMGFHLFHEAWSTATIARGPIFPTHNLQFHILFPSRVRQLVDGGG